MKGTLSARKMHEMQTRTRLSDRVGTRAQIRRHQRLRQEVRGRSFCLGSPRLKDEPVRGGRLLYFSMVSRLNHAACVAEKRLVTSLVSVLDNSTSRLRGIENEKVEPGPS